MTKGSFYTEIKKSLGIFINKYLLNPLCENWLEWWLSEKVKISHYLFIYYSLYSILSCTSFRYTAEWLNSHKCPLNISGTHLELYIVIILLLTIFPILYFISLWLFYNYQFVLFNLFTFFTQSPKSLPSCNHKLVLCIRESVSIWFVHLFCSLDST